ncbi:response regulator [Ktedonosporobacter rubrisoli]|uniref:Response regulator n=1 Tax=Ktedonosporobacter rubrisoli TaxID=2509675 RepID=A0A4P6K0D3_KTERU|nr:response regulator [Ktedonosporobacter rubrisoli]QBD80856.1 response regulator [Ktedonosporobacter rubrisoli]
MARILVINDTQELLEMFRLLLEAEGYEIVLSGTPILKVSEIEEIKPDLIILDIIFGNRTVGWQMLEMLKMWRSTASIPIIVCSAATHDVQEQEGYLVAHNVRVLYKPFDIDDMFGMVKTVLSGRRTQ